MAEPQAQIDTLSGMLTILIESEKFAEAAELVLVLRQSILKTSVSVSVSLDTIIQYSAWVILCAEHIVQIPEEYFEKNGTNQNEAYSDHS